MVPSNARVLLEVGIGGGAVLAWLVLYAVLARRTRPTPITSDPATQDFGGSEPPAVVALLADRWRVGASAVEATMLDLAARGYLELRQLGGDPRETTVHVDTGPQAAGARGGDRLTPYEHRILDRVTNLSRGGVVPITALTFRDAGEARRWRRRVAQEVVQDARRRGLSRPRIPRWMSLLLLTAAGLAAAVVGLVIAVGTYARTDETGPGVVSGLVTFVVLAALTTLLEGERDTAAGRRAAAAWSGLGAYLAGDEAFGRLPPAAVTVWGRYLPYAVALGAAPVCASVLDLGMGDPNRVWSAYTGDPGQVRWRQVRIRYPRVWWHYGRPAAVVAAASVAGLGAGVAGLFLSGEAVRAAEGFAFASDAARAELVLRAVGAVLVVVGGYGLLRALVDVAAPADVTGEVLWKRQWRTKPDERYERRHREDGEHVPRVPWLYHLAVDDGRGDRTRAWALPVELQGRVTTGDVVRIRARRWTRLVLDATLVERPVLASAMTFPATDATSEPWAPDAPVAADVPPPHGVPDPATLVTAEEAGQALGLVVEPDGSVPDLGFATRGVLYVETGRRGAPVLAVSVRPPSEDDGAPPKALRRARKRGTPLTGVGDEAYLGPGWGLARRGSTLVFVRLFGRNARQDAGAADAPVSALLALAVERLPQEQGSATL
jgi:hypothetical protein